FIIYASILLLGIAMILFFGTRKQGFHEDEIYSYFSSNRTAGVAWPDREWMDTQTLTDEMVVLPGEGFRYGLVRTVQSWDVHPPLWYDILHTACSLVPGTFTKWTGIGVNLAAFVLCYFLLLAICRECRLSHRFTALFLLLWAIHPLTVSAAMFIRMYLWFTVFVLACAWLHLRMLHGFTKRRMAGVMIISFLGFLTHYYYLIFFFFTGVTICLLWFLQKTEDTAATELNARIGRIVRYVICCAVSLAAAILYYPASLSHIFRGYRGREAAEALRTASGWAGRLSFFGGLVNDFVFGGALPVLLFLYLVLVIGGGRVQRRWRPAALLLGLPTFLYFLVVSATALLLGNTSNRYLMPVDPLIYLLVLSAGYRLLRRLIRYWRPERGRDERHLQRKVFRWRMLRAALIALFVAVFLFIDLNGLFITEQVLFLYPENAAAMETARANRDIPVIILYNEKSPENIWRLYDKLAVFPRVYYVNAANGEPLEEKVFKECPELYVFAADTEENMDRDARLADLMRGNPQLEEKEALVRDVMWTWYDLK
nr:hypothetical protein [Lachnospiraceae bacterium]